MQVIIFGKFYLWHSKLKTFILILLRCPNVVRYFIKMVFLYWLYKYNSKNWKCIFCVPSKKYNSFRAIYHSFLFISDRATISRLHCSSNTQYFIHTHTCRLEHRVLYLAQQSKTFNPLLPIWNNIPHEHYLRTREREILATVFLFCL